MFRRLKMALLALFNPVRLWGTVVLDNDFFTIAPSGELKLKSRSVRMCCPECGLSMYRSDRKEDWHIDKSGFAQFSCRNPDCSERPRYRRVDVLEKAMEANEQSRADKQAQEHIAFEQLTELENRLTIWMREKYPGHFRGQFPNVAEIAIYVMSGGKEGKVTGGLQPGSRPGSTAGNAPGTVRSIVRDRENPGPAGDAA